MPAEMSSPNKTKGYYQITVVGKIDPSWSEWMENMQLISHKDANGMYLTTLSGALKDQAALRGLLNRLWDLNLVLHSIHQLNPTPISPLE